MTARPIRIIGPLRVATRLAVFFALLVIVQTCSDSERSRIEEIHKIAPEIPTELLRHLVASDDSTLIRYVREIGWHELNDAFVHLNLRFNYDSIESYQKSGELLYPLLERIALMSFIEFHQKSTLRYVRKARALRPEEGRRHHELLATAVATAIDSTASNRKIEILEECAEEFERLEFYGFVANCQGAIAETYAQMGVSDSAVYYFNVALQSAVATERYQLTCQFLGVIGTIWESEGEIDSMKVYYDRALEIAIRTRNAIQAARITSFYADYYKRQGRLSLASALYNQALEWCREYKCAGHELRYIVGSMSLHAELGAWETVGRLLPRARVAAAADDKMPASSKRIWSRETEVTEARYLMAKGRVEEANEIFSDLAPEYAAAAKANLNADFLYHWAQGLALNERWEDALRVSAEGSKVAEAGGFEPVGCRFSLLRARASVETGDFQSARRLLDRFEQAAGIGTRTLYREWHERDMIRVALYLARGDTSAAFDALNDAVFRLTSTLCELEGSAEAYLWLGRCNELRNTLHELVKDDAELGYGVEFLWRDLYRSLGSRSRGAVSHGGSEPVIDGGRRTRLIDASALRRYAESARTRFQGDGAIHCLYAIRNDEVWRWTLSPAGIRRETLDMSVDELGDIVSEAWQSMASDPGDANAQPPRPLETRLEQLAGALLPPEALEPRRSTAPFYVTAAGFLRQIPFEALDISRGDTYEPLLSRRDVVYVRHLDGVGLSSEDPHRGVIVVNTEQTPLPGFFHPTERRLRGALEEGEAVSKAHPNSILLEGESATEANLVQLWADAPFIYVASHVVRDPDVPYLSLLPLATTGLQAGPDAAFLDVADIRKADLSACRVVVLSGCSSGVPYVGLRNTGPSLGDAFLDAGAGAVVQTFWDVRDDEATALMSAFARSWDGSRAGAVRALCKARRGAMAGPDGIRHPFAWAAYSIESNGW